ncbi:MAG TPA: thiolase family protein [Streptosporangiaceae bacterium]|nr:thiolase family protein [Streptosporangiaceae bacterium]
MSTTAVIAGVGKTRLGSVPELTTMGLIIDAATKAVADAGLTMRDIDGLVLHPFFGASPRYHILVAESLGIFAKTLCDTTMMGGAQYGATLQTARWAIEDGLCRNVLIVAGEKLRTGHDSGSAMMAEFGAHNLDYEYPYGATVPAYYGLLAERYLHQYGLDSSALAQIAVATRAHAVRNPDAEKRDPITVEDVLASPIISTPLHRLDCSLVSDGGAAYVVSAKGTSANPNREVELLGLGQAHSGYHMGHLARGDDSHDMVRTVVDIAGRRAFEKAGVSRSDIDVAGIYDSFTITTAIQLEDLGFCGRGEAGDYVKAGNMDLGGPMPTNTHGGLLSCAHPGACGGMLHIIEAVTQLRGEAGARQVPDAETALVTSASAVASNYSVSILGKAR